MNDSIAYYLISISCSPILVAALLFVRTRVRRVRRRTIDELRLLFFSGEEVPVAAFDYVRAKYEMTTVAERSRNEHLEQPTSDLALLGSSLPYILICAVGSIILLVPFAQLELGTWGPDMVYDSLFWSMSGIPDKTSLREAAAIFGAAFLGGYLMTGRMLLRAVQNYELSQLTFLQAASQLVFGIVSGMMIYHVLRGVGVATHIVGDENAFYGFLLVAFIGGYVPTLGITMLVQQLRVRVFKTVDAEALDNARSLPLEVLDGVDYEIKNRLDQAGYSDVQNLATANPILLYVETPYGLYCAFDWVLQAQLCVAVGPRTFSALKRFNIRTSLDLERAVLSDDAPEDFVQALGPVLFPPEDPAAPGAPLSTAAVKHGVMAMLDDLHVHRVRMLWRHIYDQITGPEKAQWLYRSVTLGGAIPRPGPPVITPNADPRTMVVAVPADAPPDDRTVEDPVHQP